MADIADTTAPIDEAVLLDGSKVTRQSDGALVQRDPAGRVVAEGAAAQQALQQDQFQRDQNAAPPVPAIHPNPPEKGAIGTPVTKTGDVAFTNPEAVPPPGGAPPPGALAMPAEPTDQAVTEPVTSDGQAPWEVRIPPSGPGADFGKVEAAQNRARESAVKAAEAQAEVEKGIAADKAAAEAQYQADKVAQDKAIVAAQDTRNQIIQGALDRDRAFENELKQAQSLRIDPTRFWTNKSEGQKAMTILAGALFGFAGKGMEYLNHIDSLIQQDVKIQMDEKAAFIQNIHDRYTVARRSGDIAQRHSQDVIEERIRQSQARYSDFKHSLESIDVAHMGPAAEARKEVAIAHIDNQMAQYQLQLQTAVGADANHRASQRYHEEMAMAQMVKAQQIQAKPNPYEEKRKTEARHIEEFVQNIRDNIAEVRSMIQDKGTYEVMGPHNEILNARLLAIGTDLAKLRDPGSVAKEGEVRRELQGLPKVSAFAMRNETALATLDNLEKQIEQRRRRAYEIRTLSPPGETR